MCRERERERDMGWMTVLMIARELISSWEVWKETLFQKLLTYNLPPVSSILLSKDVSGLNVIVTGCSSGIGLHTARELAMAGAHVIMACINVKDAKEIKSIWTEEAAQNSRIIYVEVMELDLCFFSSVRRFADEWEQRVEPLHILINNAGILLGEPERFTSDGIEQHIQVNHVAPALLALLLLPSLLRAPSSRIINVNSVGHHCGVVEPQYWNSRIEERKFNTMRAYGSSKLAHIMFLKVLASKLLERNKASIQCIAVHPGAVCTNLVSNFQNAVVGMKFLFMYDPAEGARSTIFCATSDGVAENLVNGFAYYSCSCKPGKVSPKAEDMDACLEVWRNTIDIVEVNDDYLSRVLDNVSI